MCQRATSTRSASEGAEILAARGVRRRGDAGQSAAGARLCEPHVGDPSRARHRASVDEINSKHPASHPELLEWLAQDFAAHGYDIRRLVRGIVLSRVYQLARPMETCPGGVRCRCWNVRSPRSTLARSARIASGREPEDAALRRAFAEASRTCCRRVPTPPFSRQCCSPTARSSQPLQTGSRQRAGARRRAAEPAGSGARSISPRRRASRARRRRARARRGLSSVARRSPGDGSGRFAVGADAGAEFLTIIEPFRFASCFMNDAFLPPGACTPTSTACIGGFF